MPNFLNNRSLQVDSKDRGHTYNLHEQNEKRAKTLMNRYFPSNATIIVGGLFVLCCIMLFDPVMNFIEPARTIATIITGICFLVVLIAVLVMLIADWHFYKKQEKQLDAKRVVSGRTSKTPYTIIVGRLNDNGNVEFHKVLNSSKETLRFMEVAKAHFIYCVELDYFVKIRGSSYFTRELILHKLRKNQNERISGA